MIERRKTTTDMQNLSISQNNSSSSSSIDHNSNSNNLDGHSIYQQNLRLRAPLIRKYPPFRTTIAAIIFFTLGSCKIIRMYVCDN